MAKKNSSLAAMSVDALIKMRDDIGEVLSRRASELKHQLARLAGAATGSSQGNGRRGKAHPRKGKKVAPKYRDPKSGATWAGRGAKPRWMQAYIKEGHSAEDYAIGAAKAARGGRKKTRKARKAHAAA